MEIADGPNLRAADTVARKDSDILVAADPSSQSGKAAKARRFVIPVVDVRDFACAASDAEIPTY